MKEQTSQGLSEEIDRIRAIYRDKDGSLAYRQQYSPLGAVALGYHLQRLRALGELLRVAGLESLADLRILDVGCGTGGFLSVLPAFGADPRKLCGIELMPERLAQARAHYPHIRFEQAPGDGLPVADGSFDLVIQSLVFSSIHLAELRQRLAAECARVLTPGGHLFWWDMFHLVDCDHPEPLDPHSMFPAWPIREKHLAWIPKPSDGMPRRLWRYSLGRFADWFAAQPTHCAALLGPKP